MKTRLDMDKVTKGLGGERRGKVEAKGGYFGAMQVAADVEARFRVPARGGRATNPSWTEQRLLRLAPETLRRLEKLAKRLRADRGIKIEPMQIAALLLERTAERLSDTEAEDLIQDVGATDAGVRRGK
jgi:hypothetical protein